jgi:putative ABC transport system permease protein
MKFLPLVWRNLTRRKIRTIFTLLSIAIGFVLFGAAMAIRAAFSLGVEVAGADRILSIHKVSLVIPLPKSYLERIRTIDGVKEVSHANWFGGYYQNDNNQFATMAVDPESWLRMYPEFQLPEEQKKAWFADRTGAVVGIDTATKYGWKIGDRVPLIGTIYRRADGAPWEFTIDGIYTSDIPGTDKTQFFFHYEYLNESIRGGSFGSDFVGWYVMRVVDPAQSADIARRIDALFANSAAETKTSTEKAFVQDFAKQVGEIGTIMIAIVTVAMFMILMIAGNTMAQSVRERTNELAVLKTLGFTQGRVISLVLLESCAMAVLAGGIGLGIAYVIIAQGDPTNGLLPAFYFPMRDLIIGVALVVTLGVLTGLLPAAQAGRLKIVDALRRA